MNAGESPRRAIWWATLALEDLSTGRSTCWSFPSATRRTSPSWLENGRATIDHGPATTIEEERVRCVIADSLGPLDELRESRARGRGAGAARCVETLDADLIERAAERRSRQHRGSARGGLPRGRASRAPTDSWRSAEIGQFRCDAVPRRFSARSWSAVDRARIASAIPGQTVSNPPGAAPSGTRPDPGFH